MKPFVIDSSMTSMGGVFYPTGHVFAMFPDEASAQRAASALQSAGHRGDCAYASPETILEDIVHTLGTTGAPLPSVGAENDMVRRIADLASTGHHGMLITMGDEDTPETVVAAIATADAISALYYRTFIIEDLISVPVPEGPQSVVVGTHVAQS